MALVANDFSRSVCHRHTGIPKLRARAWILERAMTTSSCSREAMGSMNVRFSTGISSDALRASFFKSSCQTWFFLLATSSETHSLSFGASNRSCRPSIGGPCSDSGRRPFSFSSPSPRARVNFLLLPRSRPLWHRDGRDQCVLHLPALGYSQVCSLIEKPTDVCWHHKSTFLPLFPTVRFCWSHGFQANPTVPSVRNVLG